MNKFQLLILSLIVLLCISYTLMRVTRYHFEESRYIPKSILMLYWSYVLIILSLVVKTAIMYFSSLSIN